jgi:hypothetical protein
VLTATARPDPDADWRAARDDAAAGPHLGDAWLAYRRAQGATAQYVTVRAGEGAAAAIVAVGVVHLRRARWRPWKRAAASADRLPWWTAAGRELAARDATATTGLARALIGLARGAGWRELSIDSFDGPQPPPDLRALRCETSDRHEFLVDLAAPAEERFARLKASHRRKVRDAEASGVTVADETGRASLDLLRELQGATQERRAERGEEMRLPDRDHYARLAATFVAGGAGRLIVGRLGGAPVSAVLCGVSGARAYYLMGGTNAAGLEVNAATLVLVKAATLLAEEGVRVLNLGGVPRAAADANHPANGLDRFKEGFGAARVECTSGIWRRGASGEPERAAGDASG